MKRLISWNVNGIRAAEKKELFQWMQSEQADVIALQETKAQPQQLTAQFHEQPGYYVHFASAERKGYSGVAVYSKEKPLKVYTLDIEEFDAEGRTLFLDFADYTLINAYFPNSQEAGKRIDYKIRFCTAMQNKMDELSAKGKKVILCGDYNVAHKPIDLTNPKPNEGNPGYLPQEREWMDQFTSAGYIDTFRVFNQEPEQYSWWSYRFQARTRNIGWRIDYFCVNPALKDSLKTALIHQDIMGSDHCPIELQVDVTKKVGTLESD